jgi:hypothetical protein
MLQKMVEDGDVENDDVEEEEEEEDDVVGDDDVEEEEDRSQDRAARLVRACTVDMHLEISQEPLYTEIYKENATPQEPPATARRPHFVLFKSNNRRPLKQSNHL